MKKGWKEKFKTPYGYIVYILILPAIILLGLYSIFPPIYSIVMSFFSWNMVDPSSVPQFVGLKNFFDIFKDINFIVAARNSIFFSAVTVAVEFVFGLGLALLVSQEIKGASIFRSFLLIPLVITPVVIGLLWRMIFNPSIGLFNYLLGFFNIPAQAWVAEPKLAMFAIIFVEIWQWTPFIMIVYVAGLKSLPTEPFEAAIVDGASRWQVFRYITFPLLMPVTIVILLIRIMDSFKVFDTIYVLTRGGPGISTEVFGLYIFKQGLKYFHVGKSSAATIIFVIVIFIISFFAIRKTLRVE